MLSHICIGGLQPFKCLPPLPFVTTLRFDETTRLIRGTSFDLRRLSFLSTLMSESYLQTLCIDWPCRVSMSRWPPFSPSHSQPTRRPNVIESILNTIRCPALESLAISSLEIWVDGLSDTLILPLPSFPMHDAAVYNTGRNSMRPIRLQIRLRSSSRTPYHLLAQICLSFGSLTAYGCLQVEIAVILHGPPSRLSNSAISELRNLMVFVKLYGIVVHADDLLRLWCWTQSHYKDFRRWLSGCKAWAGCTLLSRAAFSNGFETRYMTYFCYFCV